MDCIEKLYLYKDIINEKDYEKKGKENNLQISNVKKMFAKINESDKSIQKYNEDFAKTTNEIFIISKDSISLYDKSKKTLKRIKIPVRTTKVKSIKSVSKKQRISHNVPKKRRNIK